MTRHKYQDFTIVNECHKDFKQYKRLSNSICPIGFWAMFNSVQCDLSWDILQKNGVTIR